MGCGPVPGLCVGASFSTLIKKKGIHKIKENKKRERKRERERNAALQKRYHQLLKPTLFSDITN